MMKKTTTRINALLICLIGFNSIQTFSQQKQEKMKLATIHYEVEVNVTAYKAWEVLSSYGDVGSYHTGVVSSKSINGTSNTAQLGCDRICHLQDGKRKIMVKEKIIDFSKGNYYTYHVYDWDNFPLKKMLNTFGVKKNDKGKTVIYQTTEYRLKPRFLTGIMKRKLRKNAREALLFYKHYMETGEKNASADSVKNRYKNL